MKRMEGSPKCRICTDRMFHWVWIPECDLLCSISSLVSATWPRMGHLNWPVFLFPKVTSYLKGTQNWIIVSNKPISTEKALAVILHHHHHCHDHHHLQDSRWPLGPYSYYVYWPSSTSRHLLQPFAFLLCHTTIFIKIRPEYALSLILFLTDIDTFQAS